jgi:hypothetical protein
MIALLLICRSGSTSLSSYPRTDHGSPPSRFDGKEFPLAVGKAPIPTKHCVSIA